MRYEWKFVGGPADGFVETPEPELGSHYPPITARRLMESGPLGPLWGIYRHSGNVSRGDLIERVYQYAGTMTEQEYDQLPDSRSWKSD